MVAKTEVEVSNKMDTAKLGLAVLVLLTGVAGFYYFEAESLLYRVLGLLVFVMIALGIYIRRIWGSLLLDLRANHVLKFAK